MYEYLCSYCSFKCESHQDMLDHACSKHPTEPLQYRKVVMHPSSGKFGYSRILYNELIPSELERRGKSIRSENSNVIVVTLQSENTPHSKKKMKASTPQKDPADRNVSSSRKLDFASNVCVQDQSNKAGVHRKDETDNGCIDIECDEDHRDLEELYTLLPKVVDNLKEQGHLESYKKYCKLLAEGRFPHDNICHLLFLDLIEWYSQDSSTTMRYRFPETVEFWRIGYKLFKGKFLRFMGGPKSAGNVIDDSESKGKFLPENSQVNFVVPSFHVLADKGASQGELFPGVIHSTLDSAQPSFKDKPLKLAIDGKKISRGRGKKMGDIDCWGFEAAPTLKQQTERLEQEIENTQVLFTKLDSPKRSNAIDFTDFRSEKHSLVPDFQTQIQTVGRRLNDLRTMLLSTERTIDKFTKLAGENWRKSKFFPLIACLRTTKYDVEKHIEDGLRLVNRMTYFGAILNNADNQFCKSDAFCMSNSTRYVPLNPFQGDLNDPNQWQYVNQRSDQWFKLRKTVKVTGSTMNAACGLDSLKKQQEHYDSVIFNKEKPDFTTKQQENMAFGVANEINAVATTVSKIMPLYYPELSMFEEGCKGIMHGDSPFMIVSPDGSLRATRESAPVLMYETKCRSPKSQVMPVYYQLPKYYVLQVLSEMKAYSCDKLLFTCWSPKSTIALEVSFSEQIWQQAWDELVLIFDPMDSKRPFRVSATSKELRCKTIEFTDTSCKFLGEFPSVKNSDQAIDPSSENESRVDVEDVLKDIRGLKRWFENAHELTRKEATEILVFMLSDLDRHFNLEKENALPIAYAMKGPSLNNEVFRNMTDYVISECENKGLTICVTSADGQWHKYGVRNSENEPLTKYQLQRELYGKMKKQQKNELLKTLKDINSVEPAKLVEHVAFEKTENQILVGGHFLFKHFPKLRPGMLNKSKNNESTTIRQNPPTNESDIVENIMEDIGTAFQPLDAGTIDALVAHELPNGPDVSSEHSNAVWTDALGEALQILYQDPSLLSDEDLDIEMLPVITEMPDKGIAGEEISGSEMVIPIDNDMVNHELEGQPSCSDDNSNPPDSFLTLDDIIKMKSELAKIQKPKRPDWGEMNQEVFAGKFENACRIEKSFTRVELLCCLRAVTGKLKSKGLKCKLSSSKTELVNLFSKVLGDKTEIQARKRKLSSPKCLRLLCTECIRDNYSKECLNIIMSEYEWANSELRDWKYQHDSDGYLLDETFGRSIDWFSIPSVVDNRVRFHFTDPSHILTCLRTKLCTTGIQGLDIKAWEFAALSEDTYLNISLIVECVDKQSVAFAKSVFARDVQEVMKRSGFSKEANFCKLIFEWFEAEDVAGIPAYDRVQRRLDLRDWLLEGVDFGVFPPQSSYIRGIPIITYEALLAHLERKIQMYAFTPGGYNVRAIGTLEVEQFFGTFRDIDPAGIGTPRPDDIPRMMTRVADITNCRMDPERKFYVRTSKATVYPEVVYDGRKSGEFSSRWKPPPKTGPYLVEPCDHHFDGEYRVRVTRKKKKTDTISSPRKPSLGVRGVRTLYARDESKILDFYKRNLRDVP